MWLYLMHVVDEYPNFMRLTPVMAAVFAYGQISQTLVHTGQHYDAQEWSLNSLASHRPIWNLGIGTAWQRLG